MTYRTSYSQLLERDALPLSEFFELWPDLEELLITGDHNHLVRSYDSDFCGINDEEAELLRGKDEEFLEAVHIVPTKPSLTLMIGN